ncbi:MAG TPA: phosphonopyruvate decarboxylase [Tissierellaceae bacterium]|jgi:phosphonopyruvate decarboxylase
MDIRVFMGLLQKYNISFFSGVPDSQLRPLCDYLMNTYGISDNHIIAVNEGNAVALAAGYYLSTGKIPCVYLQNSGLGNIVNPVTSLLNDKVYAIPCVFIIGWRGEPNVHDEPQHVFQGEITLKMLDVLEIAYMIIDRNTTEKEIEDKMNEFEGLLNLGKSVAFVVKKHALYYNDKVNYKNNYKMLREDIIRAIVDVSKEDIIVSTTGKTSRELFEIREQKGQLHKYDFLTVGSMGHSSTIALAIALNKPNKRVWCIDGDGAALMHMGAMALIGAKSPGNYIHVIINNEAHESVGGQPTIAHSINFSQIALGCGYKAVYHIATYDELNEVLFKIKDERGPILLEVKSAIGSRDDLGRPTTTPIQNKKVFMDYLLKECD